tara:strand:+ start:397 stop:987 length:591 start_codon:yes stop_codon:yes gene_type:complete
MGCLIKLIQMNDVKKEQSYKSMLMFGMFSIVMLFAGLTSAYIVSKGYMGSQWSLVPLPQPFLYSLILICISSVLLFFSKKYFEQEQGFYAKNFLLFCIILGFGFCVTQYLGWKDLISDGYFFVGSSNASSYIYVFSGLHLAHLIFGLFFLLQSYVKMNSKYFPKESNITFKLKNWFWHFLGFLWVYLYCFLLFYNS